MKYEDLPLKTLEEVRETTTYIICSNIKLNEDESIESIDKWLLDTRNLASKNEVFSLSEQNAQLVKIINQIVTKQQDLEKTLALYKTNRSESQNIEDIQKELDLLKKRIDENVVEF